MNKKNIIYKAGVLLIAVIMVSSIIPVAMADTTDIREASPRLNNDVPLLQPKLVYEGNVQIAPGLGGDNIFDFTNPVLFHQPYVPVTFPGWNAFASNSYHTLYENFYGVIGDICSVNFTFVEYYDALPTDWNIRFYDSYTSTTPIVEFLDVTADSSKFLYIDPALGTHCTEFHVELPTPVSMSDGYIHVEGATGTTFWVISGAGDGTCYQNNAPIVGDVAVTLFGCGSGDDDDDCIPGACDFYIESINNVEDQGVMNSLPAIINVTIGNGGMIHIGELKILADVFEKVCGDSTIWCDDLEKDKYDPRFDSDNENWTTFDDPADDADDSGDTWVLQKDEFHSADQAYRCTAGIYRSTADEDVYVGRSVAIEDDYLEWAPANMSRRLLAGAAGGVFTFWHKATGEYTTDEDGNAIVIDYGWIQYSLDDGATWVDVSISDFVAYDNGWEQMTIKFINTAANGGHYDTVCDGMACDDDADNTLCIEEDFDAEGATGLKVRFNWYVNPCHQFEGWYIDDVCFERVEEYALLLVHQTHEIIDLDACTEIDYEFPLGFDPEPDTWYMLCIHGQVFAPQNCEADLENNELCIQFQIGDVHDIACLGLDFLNATTLDKGDEAWYDITIKNVGTFPEISFPVDLKVAKTMVDKPIDADFEDNDDHGMNEWGFIDTNPESLWRWTEGDDTIVGPRSSLPGEESLIYADEGEYPILKPNVGGLLLSDTMNIDVGPCEDYTFEFDVKWSLPETFNLGFIIWTDSGPFAYKLYAWGTWNPPAPGSYSNDWVHFSFDIDDEVSSFVYEEHGVEIMPDISFGFYYYADLVCGQIGPSPDPWGGFMIDDLEFTHTYPDGMGDVVQTIMYPDDFGLASDDVLEIGETATGTLKWIDTEYCSWTAYGDTQLPTDVDESNDYCCNTTRVMSTSDDYFDFESIDLTCGDPDSLWHLCSSRPPIDDTFYWAGDESTGFYAPNMDDSLVGEVDLSAAAGMGALLSFNTYYDFFDLGDFGEVYVRDGSSDYEWYTGSTDDWTFLTRLSGGPQDWTNIELTIPGSDCTNHTQIKFRMVSNDLTESWGGDIMDEAEGWYVDDIEIWSLTTALSSIEDMSGGVPPAGWSQEEPGEWASWAGSNAGGTSPEARLSWGSVNGDFAYLQTGPIDTSGGALFEFKSYLNAFSSYLITAYIEVSNDGGSNWYDVTPWTYPTGDQGPTTYTINPGLGTNTIIRWVFDDIAWNIDYWYLDDFAIYDMVVDVLVAEDDFEGDSDDFIWSTFKTCAGDFWSGSDLSWCLEGYGDQGPGLNNALVTDIDLTDEALLFAEVSFDNIFDVDDGCFAYVEFSDDGGSSWDVYYMLEGPALGTLSLSFDLTEFLGSVIKMRLRYTTPGNGLFSAGGSWCVDNFLIIYKEQVFVDETAPVTTLVFDDLTGTVSLFAYDPTGPASSGVCVTYYKIDGGATTEYTSPFTLSEGNHNVEYWSVDCVGNEESHKTSPQLVVDTSPPTVSITAPENGIYLFGNKLLSMGSKPFCIGKVTIEADANDVGTGVTLVTFDIDGDTGYDASAPYAYTYRGMKFGSATATVTAYDGKGLTAQDSVDFTIFSLGLI